MNVAISLRPHICADEVALGVAAAERIVAGIAAARTAGRNYVLGCPAGRSPRSTYAALARLVAAQRLSLSHVHLVMMDEYVQRDGARWALCDEAAHYSCRGFGEREIRAVVNLDLPAARQIPRAHLHAADPNAPEAYDDLIAALGGIDLFLLASGASDGHVAFNPPGVPLSRKTSLVELAHSTRRDNLGTFPQFPDIDAVPHWGVSISPGSIKRLSRAVTLLLPGAGKALALKRVMEGYDSHWPASIVHLCQQPIILTDQAAYQAMESL